MELKDMALADRYRFAGNLDQLYGIQEYTLGAGKARDQHMLRVTTGGGLAFDLQADNALDIGAVAYRGYNMNFLSKNGLSREFYPFEDEFLRTFPGGMLFTCGMLSAGPGCRDEGTWHPLHGRAHSIPVDRLSARVVDERLIEASGRIRETQLFGQNLQIERTITAPVGESEIRVDDVFSNNSPEPMEFMLLYHMNFGYPFLSEHLRLELPAGTATTPRTAFAKEGLSKCREFCPPVDGLDEQVFFHDIPSVNGFASLRLLNERLKIGAEVSYKTDTLPRVVEWKCMRSGDYALGIEPSNSFIHGRVEERLNGTLRTIAPFARETLSVRLRFFDL